MNPADLTVSQLKEKLRDLGLPSTGSKAELISRLSGANPSSSYNIEETPAMTEASATIQRNRDDSEVGTSRLASHYERELEIFRREKELVDRELQLARRELELLREMQQRNASEPEQTTRRENSSNGISKINITAIADLLGYFDGNTGDYEIWEKQLKLLKATYHLSDEHAKILVGMRLKGRALSWLHSKPQHIELPLDILLNEMREMYDHRPSRMRLRKQFEERMWKREETFHQYVHEKVILANRIPISDDEIIDYIIEGIPVTSLRDQANISKFTSKASLLEAFEKVTLKDKIPSTGTRKEDQQKQNNGTQRQRGSEKDEKKSATKSEIERRCFNCGLRNHMSVDCPTKAEGPKCFQCGERGHIASKCTKDQKTVKIIHTKARVEKYAKKIEINNYKMLALIDTGNDFCLMRSSKYIQLGCPQLSSDKIQFRGVGSDNLSTLGKFNANLTIDAASYIIPVHIVSDTLITHDLIIGTDFINRVKMTSIAGKISVNMYKNGAPSEIIVLDIYCQGHLPEQQSEDFSRRSFFVKKL